MNITQRWYELFDRTVPNLVLRIVVMAVGLSFVAGSVAITRASGLGTSPISCIPATLSYMTPLTIGMWTFIMNCLFVAIQIALLRREFKPIQFLQIPFVFVFSALIDLFVPFAEMLPMPNYPVQFLYTILGAFMTAFGVFLQVKASFITLPGEGIVLTFSKVTNIAFPKCKMTFDTSMVVIATVASLAVLGGLYGVREGTILSALAVGAIVGLYNRLFPHFERFCPLQGHKTFTVTTMDAPEDASEASTTGTATGAATPLVITIGREYGSGGREIGQALGRELGIPVFDHTLIELTAKESGLTADYIKAHEQEVRRGLLYNLYMQTYNRVGTDPEQMDDIWLAQARAITKLADDGACVIVGRCANAILEGRENVFNVFIHAPLVPRIGRVMKREHVGEAQAIETIERIDRERAEHARRFADIEWGAAKHYNLTIDSSLAQPGDSAKVIAGLARMAYPSAPLSPNPKKPHARTAR